MTNFNTLKKNSATMDRLAKEIAKLNKPQGEDYGSKDERFWTPEVDKAGNGYALIRFLPGPAVDGDDSLPFVKYFSHGFQGPTGKWYIEKSLTTLGKKDPVAELNSRLWKTEIEEYRKIAQKQKRKLSYVSNIQVIADAKQPQAEGKEFLYRYGKKIFDKVDEALFPPFDEQGRPKEHPQYDPTNAFNPFDFWTGANFQLKIRQVDGYRNYDLSTFAPKSALKNDDAELEKIWNREYSLKEFVDPAQYKSYDELKALLDDVLGVDSASEDVFEVLTNKPKAPAARAAKPAAKAKEEDTPPWVEQAEDDDKYFQNMADEAI